MTLLVAVLSGLVFAAGLIVSEMVNPDKVLGFLDFSSDWDPTLAFVFLGGLTVAVPGIQLVLRRGKPALADELSLPDTTTVDWPLVAGSALFGAGWGLAGFCPGPAVTAMGAGVAKAFVFVAAMVAGMVVYKVLARWRENSTDG